jgi:hypothetical protein
MPWIDEFRFWKVMRGRIRDHHSVPSNKININVMQGRRLVVLIRKPRV